MNIECFKLYLGTQTLTQQELNEYKYVSVAIPFYRNHWGVIPFANMV